MKTDCCNRIINVFAYLILAVIMLLVFTHISYLQNYSNTDKNIVFIASKLVAEQFADKTIPLIKYGIDGLHTAKHTFTAQEPDIENPSLIISEFMTSNGSKLPLAR